ncbi:MAG: hypothetical protein ABFQ95_01035 [Pseudomonadota bacterium]
MKIKDISLLIQCCAAIVGPDRKKQILAHYKDMEELLDTGILADCDDEDFPECLCVNNKKNTCALINIRAIARKLR